MCEIIVARIAFTQGAMPVVCVLCAFIGFGAMDVTNAYSMLCNSASGPEVGLPGGILAGTISWGCSTRVRGRLFLPIWGISGARLELKQNMLNSFKKQAKILIVCSMLF